MREATTNASTGPGLQHCPIPNTHQRLRQAHLLWHQASENYQDVDRFLTNINSLIQELRNVTFILQSEKSQFTEFESWYRHWQEKLKNNRHAQWLKDTRNLVVKQGALTAASHFNVRFLTYDSIEVVSLLSEKDLSVSTVLERDDFRTVVTGLRKAMEGQGDAVLAIERCWSTPELMGAELLKVLGSQYGFLARMVLDAHVRLGQLDCTSATDDAPGHSDFPTQHGRSDLLPCMTRAQASRTDFFTLSKLERMMGGSELFSAPASQKEVEWRYQFTDADKMKTFDAMDPLTIYNKLVYSSKKMLRKDRSLARVMQFRDGRGRWSGHMIMARNRVEKYLLMHLLAQTVREEGCDALLEVGESWIVPEASTQAVLLDSVLEVPEKEECIFVHLATRDGLSKTARTIFRRGTFGGISFSDTEETDGERHYYLKPIYQVWYEQNRFELAKGTRIPIWQPEVSDPCVCGSDQPYGVCCLPILEGTKGPLQDSDDLLAAGDIESAERHARATITRYARWIRQQTAFSLNTPHREFSEKMIPTDALALEACLAKLERCAMRTGNHDAVLRACGSLEGFVGVPVIARRLIAIAARSLIRNGRVEEGLLELGRLGKPSEMSDTQALILSVRYGDHEPQGEIQLLRAAVNSALCDEERLPALFCLADRLAVQGLQLEALPLVDEVLKQSDDRTITRHAMALKWELTGNDDDFAKLLDFLRPEESDEERLGDAAFLMSRQREGAALELLKPLLERNNPVSTLLAVECNIRLGNCPDAAQRLASIQVDASSALDVRSGFALVHGMLVLECGREDLRESALQQIKDVLSVKHVPALAELLKALHKDKERHMNG